MLVGDRMSKPVITVPPNMPITEAIEMMRREHIRRAPVIEKGKLIGIVTDIDLLNASPSPATTLSIWEMNYLISKITVGEVMTRDIFTIEEDTPIEEAARIMADNKIGGLPVIRNNRVVGIITETDIFKIFLELLGAREHGIRIVALVPDKSGELAALTKAISQEGGNFIAFGQFAGEDPSNRELTFKVSGIDKEKLIGVIQPYVDKIKDIRI
ncbi:MAG: CBS domain-containing protein [Anaerolineales bacterium]|nr:CBS domain-containing protein [Anaerolineales bacterium]